MTASNFAKSLAFVLKDEGGNDDDPQDHGGRTSRGITQREFTAWLTEQALPDSDVWQASDQQIETIYHDEYWEPLCDNIPTGTDYLYFDMAVNSGPHEATLLLQRAVGVTADGRIGPISRLAISAADPATLIETYSTEKIAFYQELHQPKFIKGWLNRVADVKANALTMIGT